MKRYLLGAAAMLAVAAPGVAAADASGHIDLSYTNGDSDLGTSDVNATALGGQVAFAGGPVGFQVDGRYSSVETTSTADVYSIGGHVFSRSESWLIGGYVGYDKLESGGEAEELTFAVEAQFYMPRSTITGVLSHSTDDSIFDMNVTEISGEYRYFFTDNFSLQGGLGFGQGELGANDIDIWDAQVGGEYQFASAPISIFAGYRHGNLDAGAADIDTSSVGVGVRYNWGGSLMDRNRHGAGLARVPSAVEHLFGSFGG